MSTPLENGIQEDLRTYPMYQRLRKINPYAYYSLNIQKQMQSDLRSHGSLVFFEQTLETMPELDDPILEMGLTEALSQAEHLVDTGSLEFNDITETILGALYATDTLPIRRSNLHGNTHKVFAALIAYMHVNSVMIEVNEYNTTNLSIFGYSKSFMQYLIKAETRSVLNVLHRSEHCAYYIVSEGMVGTLIAAN